MNRIRYILSLALCTLSLAAWSQDYARMSERTITGTARYVGMGGAMAAVGGDPSAVHDNVAGLGLYRRSEVLLSLDYAYDKTVQVGYDDAYTRHIVTPPSVSWVISLPTYNTTEKGVLFHNIMLSYHRLHSFGRTFYGSDYNGRSLGALLATLDVNWDIPFPSDRFNKAHALLLRESGYTHDFAVDWAMNISDRWYVGLGLHVLSYSFTSDGDYVETFAGKSASGVDYSNRNITSLIMSGTAFNGSVGLIYRPTGWLRLGLGLQTPTLGSLSAYTSGTLRAQTDSLRSSYAPDQGGRESGFHMPLQTNTSVAFQIGAYGMVALQYTYRHADYQPDIHSLRAGIEIIPVLGMYINAGYVYESAFAPQNPAAADRTFDRQDTYSLAYRSSQYGSVAVGYRGAHFLVQAAYQYRWQRSDLWAHESAIPYDMRSDTHRVVLTIGWHRY